MGRPRRGYICGECGHESPGWLGRCPACGSWNSLSEELPMAQPPRGRPGEPPALPVGMDQVEYKAEDRLPTGFRELDRVLGGGLVKGSLVLLGGEPGIGKSTLLLQVAAHVAGAGGAVLYVSGEESAAQIRMRAERVGAVSRHILLLAETRLEHVEDAMQRLKPQLTVVDSIQTMRSGELGSAAGSVAQVRACAEKLLYHAKDKGVPLFLVGHINKQGALAGPKVLEHCVDVVLYFEGERYQSHRVLRSHKNRYGSAFEVSIFEMGERGLEEVDNPSRFLLSERAGGTSGSVVVTTMEGSRPLLVEIQALVFPCGFGVPRRTTAGVDHNRVSLIMAVLEKRLGFRLANHDAYLKVVGGLKVDEPGVDLGIALAITSSLWDVPLDPETVVIGEIGLGGEVRAVSRAEERLKEAGRLGFSRAIIPRWNAGDGLNRCGLKVIGVENLRNAVDTALGREGGAGFHKDLASGG